jgi:diguanylate cyclase (GGDEF)-like protein
MQQELRACDTIARQGGDEFVILLVNILNLDDARAVGKKLLATIAEPIETTAGTLKISCSIGIAICPAHGECLDILRKHADQAMYEAKEQGRNMVSVFAAETSRADEPG